MSKINIFKMDIGTFWSKLLRCCAFYIVPNCIRVIVKMSNESVFQKSDESDKINMFEMDIRTFCKMKRIYPSKLKSSLKIFVTRSKLGGGGTIKTKLI